MLDALKQKGGLWFGWSGEVSDTGEPKPERTVGPIALFTIDLSRQDYDEFYRGFANGTLWPVLHYQIGLGRFEWPEFKSVGKVAVEGVAEEAVEGVVEENTAQAPKFIQGQQYYK